MDVREKLVELIVEASHECDDFYDLWDMRQCAEEIASFMIAHGVTVQELNGCEYCKEDNDGYRKMFGAFSIANPFHGNEWTINTGHCKPRQIYYCPMCGRKLSEPPKGE